MFDLHRPCTIHNVQWETTNKLHEAANKFQPPLAKITDFLDVERTQKELEPMTMLPYNTPNGKLEMSRLFVTNKKAHLVNIEKPQELMQSKST